MRPCPLTGAFVSCRRLPPSRWAAEDCAPPQRRPRIEGEYVVVRATVIAVLGVALAAVGGAPAHAHQIPQERETCKNGGWEHFSETNRGVAFANQGLCVSHVSTGGTLYHAGH